MSSFILNANDGDVFSVEDGFIYTILSEDNHTVSIAYDWSQFDQEVFEYDVDIPSIVVWNDVTYTVTEIAEYGFESTGWWFVYLPNTIISIGESAFDNSEVRGVDIPNSVVTIGDKAFFGSELVYIDIPNSVTYLGQRALSFTWLREIVLPSSLSKISDGLFLSCRELNSVSIPESIIEIGNNAFDACQSLSEISLPNSVNKIGDYAFESCESLKSFTIPESVTSIGDFAFAYCPLTSIAIPQSVSSIGDGTFAYCNKLEEITVEEGNKNYTVIDGLLMSHYYNDLYDQTSTDYDVVFQAPGTITTCTIPETAKYVGNCAFMGCDKLTTVTMPGSVTQIGLYNNESTTGKNRAFDGCTSLKTINIYSPYPPYIRGYGDYGTDVFRNVPKDAVVYVPQGSLDRYMNDSYWKYYFTDFREMEPDSVEEIELDFNSHIEEYYNLNGTRINKSDLVPGIYIKRSGEKSEKVIIK